MAELYRLQSAVKTSMPTLEKILGSLESSLKYKECQQELENLKYEKSNCFTVRIAISKKIRDYKANKDTISEVFEVELVDVGLPAFLLLSRRIQDQGLNLAEAGPYIMDNAQLLLSGKGKIFVLGDANTTIVEEKESEVEVESDGESSDNQVEVQKENVDSKKYSHFEEKKSMGMDTKQKMQEFKNRINREFRTFSDIENCLPEHVENPHEYHKKLNRVLLWKISDNFCTNQEELDSKHFKKYLYSYELLTKSLKTKSVNVVGIVKSANLLPPQKSSGSSN